MAEFQARAPTPPGTPTLPKSVGGGPTLPAVVMAEFRDRAAIWQDEPLTAAELATVPPETQKLIIGERLRGRVSRLRPLSRVRKVDELVNALLEKSIQELLGLLEDRDSLDRELTRINHESGGVPRREPSQQEGTIIIEDDDDADGPRPLYTMPPKAPPANGEIPAADGGNDDPFCFKCGEPGHWGRHCPNPTEVVTDNYGDPLPRPGPPQCRGDLAPSGYPPPPAAEPDRAPHRPQYTGPSGEELFRMVNEEFDDEAHSAFHEAVEGEDYPAERGVGA